MTSKEKEAYKQALQDMMADGLEIEAINTRSFERMVKATEISKYVCNNRPCINPNKIYF